MILISVYFSGGGRETFPVRVPIGAEADGVVRTVLAVAARKFPGKEVVSIVATRSETVLWKQ